MSQFFVGQRVRIIGAGISKNLIGSETNVRQLGVVGIGRNGFTRPGCIETTATNINGVYFVAFPEHLEPILPSGMQPAKWEDCMWQPNNETKHVDQEVLSHDNQAVRSLDAVL